MKSTETEVPLPDRLRSWAQNEEMIDQYYTQHGKDCNAAADVLADLLSALERTAYALELAYSRKPLRDMAETLAEARAAIAKAKGE